MPYCFSALIVTIRSDIESMLISRYTTLFLIPAGLVLAGLELLPITIIDSLLGAALGYLVLLVTAKLFAWRTGKEGIGQGDLELLAVIGAFTGVIGCWFALMAGSVIGSVVGITYMLITKAGRYTKIPFGPFLASGAMLYVLIQEHVWHVFVCYTKV